MIDIQLFVGCATCGWQQGCPVRTCRPRTRGRRLRSRRAWSSRGLLAAARAIPAKAALPANSGPESDDLSQSPQPCYFIGTLSQTLTLRAAFASSTYLLAQIPGPGRSSDDDLLNLNPPNPLFKGAHQASVRTRAHATASLFFGRHLMMPYLIHQSHFSRGDQGLRDFHRRMAALPANSGPASDDALSILRTVLFRLPSPEKVYRC